VLGVGIAVEVEALDQLLADVATAAFGEQRVLATQFHAWGVQAFFRVAFAVDAQVAGDDPAHHAVFVEQRFLGGEARVDFHAQVLGLLGQPAAQVAQEMM
jgi:DNA polymerase